MDIKAKLSPAGARAWQKGRADKFISTHSGLWVGGVLDIETDCDQMKRRTLNGCQIQGRPFYKSNKEEGKKRDNTPFLLD